MAWYWQDNHFVVTFTDPKDEAPADRLAVRIANATGRPCEVERLN